VKLYLAGADFPDMDTTRARLERAGFVVITAPPEPDTAPEWGAWARYALALLVTADGVCTGGKSRGSGLLCQTAHELAMPIRTLRAWLTKAGQDAYMESLTRDRT
jgi:hypothetical protein